MKQCVKPAPPSSPPQPLILPSLRSFFHQGLFFCRWNCKDCLPNVNVIMCACVCVRVRVSVLLSRKLNDKYRSGCLGMVTLEASHMLYSLMWQTVTGYVVAENARGPLCK